MIRDIHELTECPDCASLNIVYSDTREQLICRDCGLIFETMSPALEEKFETSHGISTPKPAKKVKKAKAKPKKKAKKAKPKKKAKKKKAKKAKKKAKRRR